MNSHQFIEQIQLLMHAQQIKHYEMMIEKNNYLWLTYKRCALTYMSAKDEFLIRQVSDKVDQEQRVKIVRQLISWMEEHPSVQVDKIPEICNSFLNKFHNMNIVNETTLSRRTSFRNSFRRLFPNKVEPAMSVSQTPQPSRRYVKFNDKPVVYCISD